MPRRFSLTALLVLLAALAAAPSATAAGLPAAGAATIALGADGQGLRLDGVRTLAIEPGKRRGQRFSLPASRLTIGRSSAGVRLRGGIELKSGGRRVRLTDLRLRLRESGAAIAGRAGGRSLRLFATAGIDTVDIGQTTRRVGLTDARLELTRSGAHLLGEHLGSEAIAAGSVGRLTVEVSELAKNGGAGDSPIVSGPIAAEPPLLARPASAVDVHDVAIAWYPRDSWVRYASSGVGANDGIRAGNGATAIGSTASPCPDRPSGSSAVLPYGFSFAAKPSWYDPVSGAAGIYGLGSVSFRWAEHTIDLTASDPEIEIAGAASRAIFRFNGSGGTPYPNQRADLVSLALGSQPTIAGKTFGFSLVRGTLTANGVAVFAGFYPPPDNDEFGCVSVSFTTP